MFPTISIRDVDWYIDNNCDMVLVDLRNRTDYERSHIKGAVNIPFEEREEKISRLPREKYLLFYCSRGGESLIVCRDMEQMGYQVVNIGGGYIYYRGKYRVRGQIH